MKLKNNNVNIDHLHPMLILALRTIEDTIRSLEGYQYEMTITSGNDGAHKRGSLHYKNKAIDIRNRDMTFTTEVATKLSLKLGRNFDVINEGTHIHIEYDQKD